MHTYYLCYLNHPVVGSDFRNYTDSIRRRVESNERTQKSDYYGNLSWEVTTIAMGMLLFSIGEGYVPETFELSVHSTTEFDDGSTLFATGITSAIYTKTGTSSNTLAYETSMSIVGGTGSLFGTYGELSSECSPSSMTPSCDIKGIICQTKEGKHITEDM